MQAPQPTDASADPEEQARLYKQYFSDLIRRGTEGLRCLSDGQLPESHCPGDGGASAAPTGAGRRLDTQASDAHAAVRTPPARVVQQIRPYVVANRRLDVQPAC